MSLYATLADVKAELLAENTVDDAKVMRLIRQFSTRIDTKFQSFGVSLFAPYIENRAIGLFPQSINSGNRTLFLRTYNGGISPLLSLTGVTFNNQALVIGTSIQTYPATPAPWYQLQLMGNAWISWYAAYCSNVWGVQNATVSGIWGYNANYARAWLETTTLDAAINDSVTSFAVTDIDGPNAYGESPSISAGNLIQIDSEWMDVVKTESVTDESDVTTHTLTVIRSVNGSTAAAHLDEADVSVYQVDENIRRIVTRQVAFMYSRRGAFNTKTVNDFPSVSFPPDLLQEANEILLMFANMG